MLKLYLTYLPEKEPVIPEELLSGYRKEKLLRQKNEHVRLQSAVSELLLRYALRDAGCPPSGALRIRTGRQGKPYLADGACFFSLSHSGGAVLCAIGESDLGADLQLLAPASEALMRRFYAADERDYVLRAPDRDDAFTDIWTRKESFCKASGLGLSLPLASFSVLEGRIASRILGGAAGEYRYSVCQAEGAEAGTNGIEYVENSALLF